MPPAAFDSDPVDDAAIALPDRCAVHPGRPAADTCPVCTRPRCASDATEAGVGCLVCRGVDPAVATAAPQLTRARVLAAATLAHLTSVASGFVAQEYVEVKWFSVLVPAGVGILCAVAAEHGARGARGLAVRLIAVGYAVASAALAFRLEASVDLAGPLRTVLPPYAAAAAGAWLWTQPPRRRPPAAARTGTGGGA